VEWYTFQPGDTAESVTRRHLGYADPERVCDADMRSVADPQPGDRCRVFMGHLLRLEGRVANAAQVHIAWQGPTQGLRTLAGSAAGNGYWHTEIPIKPGHYQITARLDEGPQSRVDFDVVESTGNRMARLRGMAKELVNRVVAEQRALSAEWFAAKGMNHYRDIESGRALTPEEVAERYRAESPPLLELESPAQEAGAQTDPARPAPDAGPARRHHRPGQPGPVAAAKPARVGRRPQARTHPQPQRELSPG
jgi:hypothetical protein